MADFPGQVRSGVVGSTWHPQTEQEAAMERMKQQRAWEIEDRNWQIGEQERQRREEEARQEERARKLEGTRQKAFEAYYRPVLENEARTQFNMGRMGGRLDTRMGAPGYALGPAINPYGNPIYGRPELTPPPYRISGDQQNQIQRALNTIWGRSRALEQGGFEAVGPRTAFAPTAAAVYGYGGGSSKG